MNEKKRMDDGPTEDERRDNEVKELDLAGGVEGVQAGSDGGPSQADAEERPERASDKESSPPRARQSAAQPILLMTVISFELARAVRRLTSA